MSRRALTAVALLGAAGAVATYLLGAGSPGAGEGAGPTPLAFSRWGALGCYELRLGPWQETPPGPDAGEGATRRRERARGPEESPEVPEVFDAPARLMLLPDSVDLWGRALPTRRAVPAPDPSGDPEGRQFRWMVRADTLWVLWSEDEARVGVALVDGGDGSLEGSARGLLRGGSVDASAGATAWRVSCADGTPVEPPPRRRR